MQRRKKVAILLLLIPLLTGCYTPSQLIADNLVDELCAKDGGIKVYETVTLPKERFDKNGWIDIRYKGYEKPTDDYYIDSALKVIQKNESGIIGELLIYQYSLLVYRRNDQKLLGESISYSRRGGDIPLPILHPSSYSCYKRGLERDLINQIFLKAN